MQGEGGDHSGASKMHLVGLVSSTFVMARRPTGNVELVELSIEKYHPPWPVERHRDHQPRDDLGNGRHGLLNGSLIRSYSFGSRTRTSTEITENGNRSGPTTSNIKSRAKPRRKSLEDLPADLYMEPLDPLFLRSPEIVASLGAQRLRLRNTKDSKVRSKKTSVYVMGNLGLKDDSSRRQEEDQEWSLWMSNKQPDMAQAEQAMPVTMSRMTTFSLTPKLGSPLLSSRVQHHPLEMPEEQERHSDANTTPRGIIAISSGKSSEVIERDVNVASLPETDEGFARILQELERIEEGERIVKDRKPPAKKSWGNGEISSQQSPREVVRDVELEIEQSDERGREKLPERGVPIAISRSSDVDIGNAEPGYLEIQPFVPTLSPLPSMSSPPMDKSSLPSLSPMPSMSSRAMEKSPMPSMSSPVMEKSSLPSLSPMPSMSSPVMEKSSLPSVLPMPSMSSPVMEKLSLPSLSPLPSMSSPVMEKLPLPSLSPLPSMSSPVMEKPSLSPMPSLSSSVMEKPFLPSLSPLPSLSRPMMENMGASGASPELPYSWNKKFQDLPKLAVSSAANEQPMVEERELQYPSPKMIESDVLEGLSFRVWERDSTRKSISVPIDFHGLDMKSLQDNRFPADENAKTRDLNLALANRNRRLFANPCARVCKDEGGADDSTKNTQMTPRQLSPPNFEAFLNLRTFDLGHRGATANADVDARNREKESQHDYPTPSSFTCGLSPMSLFSDNGLEPFQLNLTPFQQFPSFISPSATFNKSPRSVLSQEPDEASQFMSDSSETREKNHQQAYSPCTYLCNDESSDLESPMKFSNLQTAFKQQPFLTFTYNVGEEMERTSSDEDPDSVGEETEDASSDEDPVEDPVEERDDMTLAGNIRKQSPELVYFREAGHREPWLQFNDSDLEFLLPPNPKDQDIVTAVPEVREKITRIASPKTPHESPRRPKCQNNWVPYVSRQLHGNDRPQIRSPARGFRHGKSSEVFVASLSRGVSLEKKLPPRAAPVKRQVNFAPNLVREIPYSISDLERKPEPLPHLRANQNQKNDDEHVSPGVKSCQAQEDSPTIMALRRQCPDGSSSDSTNTGSSSSDTRFSRRQKVVQAMPCAGRLFSWPQRFAFKVSKSRPTDSSDDESVGDHGDQTFGRSARRDADAVRRILKGSQKKYANLSVAEIMKQDFR